MQRSLTLAGSTTSTLAANAASFAVASAAGAQGRRPSPQNSLGPMTEQPRTRV